MTNNQPVSRNIIYLSDVSGTGKWRRIFQESLIECISSNAGISLTHTQVPILDPRYYAGIRSVTVQRWISDQQCEMFTKLLKPLCDQNSAWLIYEIDDCMHYDDIVKYNRGRRAFANDKIQNNIKTMLNAADLVTVTTPRIKQYYHEKYGVPLNNIICVPNMIPKWWFGDRYDEAKKIEDFKKFKNKPRIGIVSSLSHYNVDGNRELKDGSEAVFVENQKNEDGSETTKYVTQSGKEVTFEDTVEIEDDFDEIVQMIRDTVDDFQWVVFGYAPPKLNDLVKARKIEIHGGVPIMNYPSMLENLRLQAIIAPIKKTTFNFCKSPIKYIEACAVGTPLFARNCPPYSDYMDEKFLYDTQEELKQKLMKLKFTSTGAYTSIINENWKWLNSPHIDGDFNLKNYWMEDNLGIWINMFRLRQKSLNVSFDFFWKQYQNKKQSIEQKTIYKSEEDPEVVILK